MPADAVAHTRPLVAHRPVPTPAPALWPFASDGERNVSAQALAAIAERLRLHLAHMAPAEFDALVEAVFLEGARAGAVWAEG
jgi:hypothetical protein